MDMIYLMSQNSSKIPPLDVVLKNKKYLIPWTGFSEVKKEFSWKNKQEIFSLRRLARILLKVALGRKYLIHFSGLLFTGQKRHLSSCLILGGLLLSPCGSAFAKGRMKLRVQRSMRVYQRPNVESKVISRLGRGDVVPISRRKVRNFRKVRVRYKGKKRWGYVESNALQGSSVVDLDLQSTRSSKTYHRMRGVGISAVISRLSQGKREIADTSGEVFEIGELISQTVYFNVFYDHIWKPRKIIRVFLSTRSSQFTGDARYSALPASAPGQEATIIQEFWGLGTELKLYSSKHLWWGGGLELAKARTVKLTLDNIQTSVNESDFPFFAIGSLVAGFDMHAGNNIYVLPSVKVGVVATAQPVIIALEALISVGYGF